MPSIPYYDRHAARLADQYESLSFEHVHAGLLDLLPSPASAVLDVGAGSGRDAAWFAANGYDVIAVDSSEAMLAQARQRHPSARVTWLPDSLPDLAKVRRLCLSFDLILLSAVWMHIAPADRERSLRKLATLLAPKGRIAISLRIGPPCQRASHVRGVPPRAVDARPVIRTAPGSKRRQRRQARTR